MARPTCGRAARSSAAPTAPGRGIESLLAMMNGRIVNGAGLCAALAERRPLH
ncbi:MAG TPA: hypothetical protein VKC16_04050 [Xanthobacteraceae bacterium]|nr:hypothetical protein [Xanthobacteraceae bacterium]